MAVAVQTGEAFAAEDPKPLFKARRKRTLDYGYDVTPDGQRFLVNVTSGEEAASPITLVVNWPATLKR